MYHQNSPLFRVFVTDIQLIQVHLISGDDRHFSVVRKGIWTIMHYGAVVIWHSKITSASLFVKVESEEIGQKSREYRKRYCLLTVFRCVRRNASL